MRLLLGCVALIAIHGQAMPQEAVLDQLAPLADDELSDLRGGLLFAGGIAFEFGAVVRTTIDGQPALETRLTWTPDGVIVEDLSALAGGPIPEFNGFGLNITDATGTTLVGHRLLDGELQGFIINTGDNRNIRQEMDITLGLPGFETIQQGMITDRLGFRIGADIADSLMRSTLD
ncbi:MAG TPA: hypothetical protein VFV70_09215 [Hyphomonadaceae bacterium]|nr:hypothetical protein [Hyphomonadaceae bacterium]